jgi:hypothetical protein
MLGRYLFKGFSPVSNEDGEESPSAKGMEDDSALKKDKEDLDLF